MSPAGVRVAVEPLLFMTAKVNYVVNGARGLCSDVGCGTGNMG